MKKFLKYQTRDFNLATTLLIGAGFSKWACDLPVVSQLFDFSIRCDTDKELKKLTKLQNLFRSWRTENPEANPESFVAYAQSLSVFREQVNWYVVRRLSDNFITNNGKRLTWSIDGREAKWDAGIQRAKRFLINSRWAYNAFNIITTNYDLVIEYALGSRGFNYGHPGELIGFAPFPNMREIIARGPRTICKLHGSISWTQLEKFPDQRAGIWGNALIVPPHAYKKAPPFLQEQWAIAKARLELSDSLTVFGFAFNEYDTEILSLLSTAREKLKQVTLLDVVDHSRKAMDLFPFAEVQFVDVSQANPGALGDWSTNTLFA